jgi:hypothetical protein
LLGKQKFIFLKFEPIAIRNWVTDLCNDVFFVVMSQVLPDLLVQLVRQEFKDRLAPLVPQERREALDCKEQRASWDLLVLQVLLGTREQPVRNY